MKTIFEFRFLNKSYLNRYCVNLVPVNCIKGTVLLNEGEPAKYVYLVRSGEFRVTKRVVIESRENSDEMLNKFMGDKIK